MTPSALAHAARVSPSSALRVLAAEPPKWTPAFLKLARFVENEGTRPLPHLADAALDGPSAVQLAAVLRGLADLIEGLARPSGPGTPAAPAASSPRRGRSR